MPDGTVTFDLHKYDGDWRAVSAEVIEEGSLTIFVNGRELATVMCTPYDPAQLALGFLANEDLIQSLADVQVLYTCPTGGCVDVWLSHSIWDHPPRRIVTSGCGGGLTFSEITKEAIAALEPALATPLTISPACLGALAARLQDHDSLYARARGVHAAAISDGSNLLAIAEDVGRHNTLDRLRGECLRRGLATTGLILLTTGRVSSEMLYKAAKMGCPVVASLSSPTSVSITLARAWNITLCGYLRRKSLNVYAHPERLLKAEPGAGAADCFEIQPGEVDHSG